MPIDDGLLRSVSRSFFLSMRFLPQAMREPISLGYLLARLSDTIADTPGLDHQERHATLEAFRDTLIVGSPEFAWYPLPHLENHPHQGEKQLIEQTDDLLVELQSLDEDNRTLVEEVLLTIIHGQIQDLEAFPTDTLTALPSEENLLNYTFWVAGSVGQFWTKVGYTNLGDNFAVPHRASNMLKQGRALGQGLQLINILRDLHEDLPAGRCYLPHDELLETGWDGTSPLTPEIVEPVFARWLEICESFLGESPAYTKAIKNARIRFSTRLPMILAKKTAHKLRLAGVERVMSEKLKISRSDVWKSMAQAMF